VYRVERRGRPQHWNRIAAVSCSFFLWAPLFIVVCGGGNDSSNPKAESVDRAKIGVGPPQQININRATVAELRTLPGVGEATAKRIVAYRSKNPPFRRIEELLIIRGISRNRLEQIRNRIRLD
jgi:competence protein ComEA